MLVCIIDTMPEKLEETVGSIRRQISQNFELIIASTERYKNEKTAVLENPGSAETKNILKNMYKNEDWFVFVKSGVICSPNFLKVLYDSSDEENFRYCDYYNMNTPGRVYLPSFDRHKLLNGWLIPGNYMIHKKYMSYNEEDGKLHEWGNLLRLSKQTIPIHVPEDLYCDYTTPDKYTDDDVKTVLLNN